MVGAPCKVPGCPFPVFDTATGVCREHLLDPGFDPATIPVKPADPFADLGRIGDKAVAEAYPDALAELTALNADVISDEETSNPDPDEAASPRRKTPKE